MCFNSKASISVFTIGIICLGVIFARKMYFVGVFYLSVIFMQLLEYFAHISLDNNNLELNKQMASGILLLVFLQPVIFSLYAGLIKYKNTAYLYTITPIIAIFTGITYLLYKSAESSNLLRISYLNKSCNSNICRLEWSFFKTNKILSSLFLIIYFFLFMFTNKYFNLSKHFKNSFGILVFLLAVSLVYMTFVDGLPSNKLPFAAFGSIWCILATLVGPYFVFFTR
tara:strand:- start:26 stop:703 length:678 start_codon:yes stop_codon:yes gene_type:complete